MSISYDQKTWYNGEEGGTPITASELNRMEQGIADAVEAINEGGGGQGGGAHTNLDNIANTTTNNVKSFATRTTKIDNLKGNYQYVNGMFVSVTFGHSYFSTDGINWNTVTNNLTTPTSDEYGFIVGGMMISDEPHYVLALFNVTREKVIFYYSYNLSHWNSTNAIPNADQTYIDEGYPINTSYGEPLAFYEINNKVFFYCSLKYSANENDALCISTTDCRNWVVETIDYDYTSVDNTHFLNYMRKENNSLVTYVIEDDKTYNFVVYQSTNGVNFTEKGTISLSDDEYVGLITYYDGVYYFSVETSLYYSSDLLTWSSKTCGYTNKFNLLGFSDGIMITTIQEVELVYLSPDSNGVYPVDKTRAQILELDNCGVVALPTMVGTQNWDSCNTIAKGNGDNIDLNYIFYLNNTDTDNVMRLYHITPFVNEVSLAANILGLGSGSSGGGSGTNDYPDLTNKPRVNGVELLGNKLVGLLSTDIQINAEKIGYSGTVSGANTAKAAIESLKSSIDNISVDADDVSYDNTTSGLSATNVQGAIDEVNSEKGNASVSVVPNTYTELYRLTNGSTGSNYDVYSSHYIRQMLDNSLRTSIDTYQPNIIPVTTLVTLKTYSSADYGKTVNLVCQFSTYTGAFDSSGNAIFNVGYVGEYVIEIDTHSRGTIFINSIGGCYHFPLSNDGIDVAFRTRDVKLIGQQLGVFDTSNNMVAKFKLTKDDYWIAIPSPSSTYVVKLYHTVNSSISQATVTVSAQFVPNTADEVLCTYPSNNEFDPIVIKDTADLTAGTSPLADGTIYLVYE